MAILVLMVIMMNYKLLNEINEKFYGNNGSNDCNHHNNHNYDVNHNNYDNDNGDQTVMIFQAMHFGEPFVCEKVEFCESAQILRCLHSVNPCLVYRRKLRFLKNHRNRNSRLRGVGGGNPYSGGYP